MVSGSLESALPDALLLRASQLLRTPAEAGDDPTMALTRARHLTTARGLGLRQSPPRSRPEDAPASGGETRPEREPGDISGDRKGDSRANPGHSLERGRPGGSGPRRA